MSMISDRADRVNTRINVKIKATAVPALKAQPALKAGRTAVAMPHAKAVKKFLEPGMSLSRSKRPLPGNSFML